MLHIYLISRVFLNINQLEPFLTMTTIDPIIHPSNPFTAFTSCIILAYHTSYDVKVMVKNHLLSIDCVVILVPFL